VRPARAGNAADVARIQVETWRQAYGSILPAPVLEALSVDAAAEAWRSAVTDPPTARHHLLVALEKEVARRLRGARTRRRAAVHRGDRTAPGRAEVGPARARLAAARGGRRPRPRGRPDPRCRLAARGDTASRAFFTSAGWAPDGLARGLDTGHGEIREVRLHVTLEDTP